MRSDNVGEGAGDPACASRLLSVHADYEDLLAYGRSARVYVASDTPAETVIAILHDQIRQLSLDPTALAAEHDAIMRSGDVATVIEGPTPRDLAILMLRALANHLRAHGLRERENTVILTDPHGVE